MGKVLRAMGEDLLLGQSSRSRAMTFSASGFRQHEGPSIRRREEEPAGYRLVRREREFGVAASARDPLPTLVAREASTSCRIQLSTSVLVVHVATFSTTRPHVPGQVFHRRQVHNMR